ncbi:MAG: glycosyltransferase family 1 protein [Acidimicrobiia bacterium]|nr:glycosyltransferase family 1 protein [Acidimicrobiia bacterium]
MTNRHTTESQLRILVTGLIAQYPLGGVTWDYIQYPAGLAALGHDVHYVEDTGQWPYNPQEGGVSKSADYNVRYLEAAMDRFGLADRWAYRFPWNSQWFGQSPKRVKELIKSADLVINVSGTLDRPHEYRGSARLVYVDSDPVFTQVKLAKDRKDFKGLVDCHDATFSFGESLPDDLQDGIHDWLPTRQPILLEEWRNGLGHRDTYTSVMNWTSYKPIELDGRSFGQKDVELRRFLDLPSRVDVKLEVAMATGKTSRAPLELLRHKGWQVVDPEEVCSDAHSYRTYLQASKGEWSVAKNGYVEGRPGWFSCRSACYLASGRPVIVQDTGFSDVLPVGEGLLAFDDLDGAVAGIESVEVDYQRHRDAALEIAREYFDASFVLTNLIERAFASPVPPVKT